MQDTPSSDSAGITKVRAYVYLHTCVFLWGFTAILGKLISLQALALVWWRVLVCCGLLYLMVPLAQLRNMSRRKFLELLGIGMMVGVHWLCFYGAIKIANSSSIAVVSMATTSFFSAFAEPFFLKRKIKGYELALGIFVLPGMALIAGHITWDMRLGLAVGILGALLAAIFTAMNKKIVDDQPPPPLAMAFVQLLGGLGVTSFALPIMLWKTPETAVLLHGWDWLWLPLLAWVCTILPYYLTLIAMRRVSAFAINLTLNLEPVYGVLLAAVVFREDKELGPVFYIGVAIILAAVFGHPFLKSIFEKQPAQSPLSP